MAPLGCEVLAGGCSFQRRVRPCPLVALSAPRVVGKGTGSLARQSLAWAQLLGWGQLLEGNSVAGWASLVPTHPCCPARFPFLRSRERSGWQ